MTQNAIDDMIADYRSADRPDQTYASTITSADVKLAYNHDDDRFEAFIIGDINANPEGIKPLSEGSDALYMDGVGTVDGERMLNEVVAEGYLHNAHQYAANGNVSVAVSMHPATYDDGWAKENWLVEDKQLVVDTVDEKADSTYHLLPDAVEQVDGQLVVDGDPVDGYVNVYDRGELLGDRLDQDVYAIARGTNAPTAVWNTTDDVRPWTDKVGLLDTANDITASFDDVHTADHDQIYSLDDALAFKKNGDPVIVKSAIGTWGDSVVALDADEYEDALETVRSEEERVKSVGNRPDSFRIVDDDGNFVMTNVGDEAANGDTVFDAQTYGLVEEAIAGTIERDGSEYTVFDIDDQPVDFVPLTTYDPETGDAETYAIAVRSAGTNNLNANRGGKNFAIQELDEAFHDGVIPASFKDIDVQYNLKDELEAVAGREVTYDEVVEPLQDAGTAALATRNISAFKAEEQLDR